jgi:hypothetical protein
LAGDIEKAADAERRVDKESPDRLDSGSATELQYLICENTRFVQVSVQIAQTVMYGSRHNRFDHLRGGMEHRLIDRQDATIRLFIWIVDRKRRVSLHASARADDQGQHGSDRPGNPNWSATHLMQVPLEFPYHEQGFLKNLTTQESRSPTARLIGETDHTVSVAEVSHADCHFSAAVTSLLQRARNPVGDITFTWWGGFG